MGVACSRAGRGHVPVAIGARGYIGHLVLPAPPHDGGTVLGNLHHGRKRACGFRCKQDVRIVSDVPTVLDGLAPRRATSVRRRRGACRGARAPLRGGLLSVGRRGARLRLGRAVEFLLARP